MADLERGSPRLRRELIGAASGLALLAGFATPALAQGEAEGGEVVVTASRVARAGFEAPTPTTVLGVEDVRKLGVTTIGQLAFEMPQFLNSEAPTAHSVRSGGGGAVFNLRGLGTTRTLFLVDSRRHVPNNPNGTTDNNVVPSALIDRLEVVTGGASAAWGSDAVAGVVNVILRKDFTGAEFELQGGGTAHGDHKEIKASLIYGRDFAGGRGNFMFSGEFGKNTGVAHVSDRDWGREGWGIVPNPAFTATNGQFARFLSSDVRVSNATYGGLITTGVLAGTQFGNGGTPLKFNPGLYPVGTAVNIGGDGSYIHGFLPLEIPLERYAVYTRASYDFSDNVQGFLEASISSSKVDYEFLDNADFGNITIQQDNAFLPASLRSTMLAAGQSSFQMGRIHHDFGAVHDYNHNDTRRVVVGLDGKFGKTWTWNAYYQFGDNREVLNEGPITLPGNLALAIDAVTAPNGQVVCRSTLTNPANGCVPINLFGVGSPSPQSIAYVTGMGHRLTIFQQHAASASLQGELFSTWAGPISVAAGADYRKDSLDRFVDDRSQANLFALGNSKNITGQITVKEVFGEAVIPLLKDQPLVKSLELNVADRYVDYSTTGSVNTWKVGGSWEVNDDLRFRATRSRDIRAPNALEFFAFGGTQFATVRDNLTGRTAFGVQLILSPNPTLQPEKADTTTFGVLYEPSWLPRFRLSVDHYKIDIEGAIVSIPAQDIADRCAAGNQSLCAAVIRNSSNDIIRIEAGRVNLNRQVSSGIDIEAAYSLPLSSFSSRWGGDLTFRGLASYVDDMITDDGRTKIERAGQVFDGLPKWKANISTTYQNGPLSLIATVRYVGGGVYSSTFTPRDMDIQEFSGRTYLNLGFRYLLERGPGAPIEFFGHANNVFDRDPPIIPFQGQRGPLTNIGLYDTIGRTFMLGFRLKY